MKYIENEIVELKLLLNDEVKNEIIAFLNSYLGGTIYIGIDNEGNRINISQKEKDLNESKVINWIRDEAIYPNCSEFVNVKYNKDGILEISIIPGENKPYYLKDKGLKPSGVYIRYGRNKSQASKEEISRMIMESNNIFYEEKLSDIQKLTFINLKLKFEEKNLSFSEFKMNTSGFVKDGKYTNLAFIFSDQYDIETKIGVYKGLDRALFKSKKEFSGSIIKQIDKTLEYYNLCNETRIVIDGSPMRKEYVSYHDKAIREAILNCYCHRDYNRRSNIKIEFFDNRCEIISPGGFYGGLTLKEALCGLQSFRNKYLVQLLHKLGYIENYSSGLDRIFKEYKEDIMKPIIETTLIMFKITFPNLNYNMEINNIYVADKSEIERNVANNVADKLEIEGNVAENVADKLKIEGNVAENVADKLEIEGNVANNVADKLKIEENVANNVADKSDEEKILLSILNNNKISRKELARMIGKSTKTVERIIKDSNRIRRVGSTKSGYWVIIDNLDK